jgi:hypothetical protein
MKRSQTLGVCALALLFICIWLLECRPAFAIAPGRVQDLDRYFRLLATNQDVNGNVLVRYAPRR